MSTGNGEKSGPLELSEILYIATKDGAELPFEVVGILEDPESKMSYAVLLHEPEGDGTEEDGEFIVTDLLGNLVDDEELAQEILDDFLIFAEESGEEEGGEKP
jgi:uncharacterized protein YrzB (UPF0473 family)